MAVIPLTSHANGAHQWEQITGSDTGYGLVLNEGGAQTAIQVTGDFGASGVLSMEGTVDGVTWAPLLTGPGGSAITFTAAGIAECATAVRAIRPSADANITDVDVSISVFT